MNIVIHQNIVTQWILTHGFKILVIGILAYVAQKLSSQLITRIIQTALKRSRSSEEKKREQTLIRVFQTAIRVGVWITAIIMMLHELGIDTAPLLASAGIVGVAIGFGGQYLIKDIINGFFIILENQYRVGDVICVSEKCGTVEDVNLRVTTIRNMDGTVHYIPNGQMLIVSNMGKDFANINIDIGVAYDAPLERVIEVINAVGGKLAKDMAWKDRILEPPHFLRVENLTDSSVVVKVVGKTTTLEQWSVAGELRMRIKLAFDHERIALPFSRSVVVTKKTKH